MPAGRPKIPIDYKQAEAYAELFCTQQEIATLLDISASKLKHDKEFLHVYKRGIENAKTSLRRCQWLSAQRGNVTMQIWLGKNYLGQRDTKEIPDNPNIPIAIDFEFSIIEDENKT